MTDEPRKAFDIDAMFEDMFGVPTRKPGETAEEWLARRDARLLPPEYAAHYTLVEVAGGMFGGGLVKCPACHRCGALVYPTALDRHGLFHETLARLEASVKEARLWREDL